MSLRRMSSAKPAPSAQRSSSPNGAPNGAPASTSIRAWSRRAVHLIPLVILALVLVLAWGVKVEWGILTPILWLDGFRIVHLAAHSLSFGVLAVLCAAQGWRWRTWLVVIGGGVALEVAQFIGDGTGVSRAWAIDTLFDLGVDVAGALVALWLWHAYRKRAAPPA